ncbi:MAG TPA: hypothetical protein GXZ25_12355 [Peptococcaceae bacterium]|jgi:hypothetical protein|nr:hypothetical protein [Peptococcaceae bacterium]
MKTVFVKLTAHRTKDGLETIKREVIGVSPEDAGERLERLAGILVDLVMEQIYQTQKEVAASG